MKRRSKYTRTQQPWNAMGDLKRLTDAYKAEGNYHERMKVLNRIVMSLSIVTFLLVVINLFAANDASPVIWSVLGFNVLAVLVSVAVDWWHNGKCLVRDEERDRAGRHRWAK